LSGIQYTLDRWLIAVTTDTGVALAQAALADSDRTGIGDEAARFAATCSFTGNSAAGANTRFIQNVENVRRLAGKTVTLSFFAYASANGLKLGANIMQYFGTGGSPSAQVNGTGQSITMPTAGTWGRYTLTFAVPSTAGKTLGTNGDDYTALQFWYSSGSTNNALAGNIGVQSGTVNIWGVQLEIGTQATPLEKRDPVLELQQCQRFYQVGSVQMNSYNVAGGVIGQTVPFQVVMRAPPTLTVVGTPSYSNATGLTLQAGPAYSLVSYATVTANGTAYFTGTFTASADL
jgi:hypothetical protein